jgi:hypothetical protein
VTEVHPVWQKWPAEVSEFAQRGFAEERLGDFDVVLDDMKGGFAAFHLGDVTEANQPEVVRRLGVIAERATSRGMCVTWHGEGLMEVSGSVTPETDSPRPPTKSDGMGFLLPQLLGRIRAERATVFVFGDSPADIKGADRLREEVAASSQVGQAVFVGVQHDYTSPLLTAAADVMVPGLAGVEEIVTTIGGAVAQLRIDTAARDRKAHLWAAAAGLGRRSDQGPNVGLALS